MDLQAAPPKVGTEPHSLAEWTHTLCNEEMPIFSNTALSIHNILSDDRKGAMELASVILQDPNLTVKLLKISNSLACRTRFFRKNLIGFYKNDFY